MAITLGPNSPIKANSKVESKAVIDYKRTSSGVDVSIAVYLRRTSYYSSGTSGTVNILHYINGVNVETDEEVSVSMTGTTWIKYGSCSYHIDLGQYDTASVTVGYEINRTYPNSGAPEDLEFDKFTETFSVEAYKQREVLTVVYNSNGADKILFQGEEITDAQLTEKASKHVYGTHYSSALVDGDNAGHLYFERNGYRLTGYWNTKSDGSGTSIDWSQGYYAEELASALGVDLSTGDKTVTVYLEWKRDTSFTPYVKVDGIRKKGVGLYVNMADGWKKAINVKGVTE